MLQPHLADDNQTEGDTDCGESGGNNRCLPLGIEAFFILFAGEQHADGAITQPGSNAVQGTSAGKIEQRTHQLDQQGTQEIQKTIVDQQGKQQTGQQEHADQNRNQVVDDHAACKITDDKIRANVEINHVGEQEADHADNQPKAAYTKEVVQFFVLFQKRNADGFVDDCNDCAERNQNPDDGQRGSSHQVQQFICRNGNGDREAVLIMNRCDKEKDTDQGWDQKLIKAFFSQHFQKILCSVFRRDDNKNEPSMIVD